MASSLNRLPLFALGCVAGAAAAALLLRLARQPPPASQLAYVLAVRLKLVPGTLSRFISLFRPLAAHCRSSEPRTLSYELCIGEGSSDDSGAEVLIYERYCEKEDLTGAHHSSAHFKAFQAALAEAGIVAERSRATYAETGVGFIVRA